MLKKTFLIVALFLMMNNMLFAGGMQKDTHVITPNEIKQQYNERTKDWKGPRCGGFIFRQVQCDNPYIDKDETYTYMDSSGKKIKPSGKCFLSVHVMIPMMSGDCV